MQYAGTYSLILTNAYRSITSRVATLSVILPPPAISSSTILSNGLFSLNGSGVAGQPYVLLSASSLTPPIVWSPAATNTSDTNGVFSFTNPTASTESERYFRVRSQ